MKTPFWPTTLQFIFKAIHLPLYTYLLWWFQKYNKHCTKSNILCIQKVDAFTTLLVCSKSSTLHNSRWTFFSHIFFTTRYPLYLVYTMTIKRVSQSRAHYYYLHFTSLISIPLQLQVLSCLLLLFVFILNANKQSERT